MSTSGGARPLVETLGLPVERQEQFMLALVERPVARKVS